MVYDALLACLNRRVPPDLITVAGELRQRAHLDLIGGLMALGEFMTEVPTAVHIGYYAENITRTATLRRLIQAGGTIAALGYAEETELDTTLDQAEQTLFAVSQRQRGADFVPISTVVAHYFARAQSEDVERVVPTGLSDLDRRLNGGLRPGQLALIAARPGMGKTGLGLTIAYELAVRQGRSVGVVSLEMSRDEILQRLLAIHTGVNSREIDARIRRGDPTLIDALGVIATAPLALEDSAMLSVLDVRSKARRLATTQPLDLLIVDYTPTAHWRHQDDQPCGRGEPDLAPVEAVGPRTPVSDLGPFTALTRRGNALRKGAAACRSARQREFGTGR